MYRFIPVILLFPVLLFSCDNSESKDGASQASGDDNNTISEFVDDSNITFDSARYYRDFDMVTFSGNGSLNSEPAEFPFVKIQYKENLMMMKICFSEKDISKRYFFIQNDVWTTLMRIKHSVGKKHYFLSYFHPNKIIEVEYSTDPFADTSSKVEAISFTEPFKGGIKETTYTVKGPKGVLSPAELTESFVKKDAFFRTEMITSFKDKKAYSAVKDYSLGEESKLLFDNTSSPVEQDLSEFHSWFYYQVRQQDKYLVNAPVPGGRLFHMPKE